MPHWRRLYLISVFSACAEEKTAEFEAVKAEEAKIMTLKYKWELTEAL